jgi:hypothetical protein
MIPVGELPSKLVLAASASHRTEPRTFEAGVKTRNSIQLRSCEKLGSVQGYYSTNGHSQVGKGGLPPLKIRSDSSLKG